MSVQFHLFTFQLEYGQDNMSMDPESRRLRSKQVGMLMRAYRLAFLVEGQARKLTQEGLLTLMAEVNPQYWERHDHSTVGRWESGATRPTRERLEVFGQALDLSAVEVDGLIRLACLEPDDPVPDGGRQSLEESSNAGAAVAVHTLEYPDPEEAASAVSEGDSPSYALDVIRYCLSRFFLPGFGVAVAGYVLASLGWSATWMLMLYVTIAIGLVLVQGFLRLRRSNDLRELLFISVFFVLSAPLLQAPLLRMDHYEFYAIGNLANTPMPILLALAFNLLLALACGLLFDFLWRWKYSGSGEEESLQAGHLGSAPAIGIGLRLHLGIVQHRGLDRVSGPAYRAGRRLHYAGSPAGQRGQSQRLGPEVFAVDGGSRDHCPDGLGLCGDTDNLHGTEPACHAGSHSFPFRGHRFQRPGLSSGGVNGTVPRRLCLGFGGPGRLHGLRHRGQSDCDHLPAGRRGVRQSRNGHGGGGDRGSLTARNRQDARGSTRAIGPDVSLDFGPCRRAAAGPQRFPIIGQIDGGELIRHAWPARAGLDLIDTSNKFGSPEEPARRTRLPVEPGGQDAMRVMSYICRPRRTACPSSVNTPPPLGATWSKARNSV